MAGHPVNPPDSVRGDSRREEGGDKAHPGRPGRGGPVRCVLRGRAQDPQGTGPTRVALGCAGLDRPRRVCRQVFLRSMSTRMSTRAAGSELSWDSSERSRSAPPTVWDPDSSRVDIGVDSVVDIAGGCCRRDYLRLLGCGCPGCESSYRMWMGCWTSTASSHPPVERPPAEERGGRMLGGLDKDRGGDEARWQA